MRSLFVAFLMMFSFLTVRGQQSIPLELVAKSETKIPNTPIREGEVFTVKSITCDMSNRKGYNYILNVQSSNSYETIIDLSKVKSLPISYKAETKDDYWYYRTIESTLPTLARMSNAYALRTKAEQAANEYVNLLRTNSMLLEDPMLTSYINSLLAKINPLQRLDFFKYNFRVIIMNTCTPNASIYPNGVLVITTGMLASIHTEDELVALLCHEANHFICNHYLENMAKIQKREKAGLIGSAILGAATGILTGSASLGMEATSLSLDLASDLNEMIIMMGLEFNQSQEIESDKAATELLPILGYDINAMATCIKAIGDYYLEEGNLSAYYKSGNHPKIEDRISATGVPYERRDSTFEKRMASCISNVAQMIYSNGRYEQAMEYARRNIDNGVARAMDHYLIGECLLACYDTEDTNNQAREALLKAREVYVDGIPTIKALIVANMRLGKNDESKDLLNELKGWSHATEDDRLWAQNMLINL